MRFTITVNSIKGDRFDNNQWSPGLYTILEAQGFSRMDRWPSGSLSAWVSESGNAIDWTVTFAVIRMLAAEVKITTEAIV